MITAQQDTLEYYQQLLSEASRGEGNLLRLWIRTPYTPRTDEYHVYRGSPVRGLVIGSNRQTMEGRATRVLFRRWPLIMLCKQRIPSLERHVESWLEVAR